MRVYRTRFGITTLCLTAAAVALSWALPARADSIRVLKSFSYDYLSGAYPYAGLVRGDDGAFYGTTTFDNPWGGYGTIFKMDSSGNVLTLHTFNWSDGAYPYYTMAKAADGSFYGTTYNGGSGGYGAAFRIDQDGNFTLFDTFKTASHWIIYPTGLIAGSDGNFYGLSERTGGLGAVYKMDPAGNVTVLYYFTGAGDEGVVPSGRLVEGPDGKLYGTATHYGANGVGTAFRINKDGTGYQTLGHFGGLLGAYPTNNLVLAPDGNMYGTVSRGGASGGGVLFRLTTGGALTTVAAFDATTGTAPGDLIVGSDGRLYGTAAAGGANGLGTIFQATTAGVVTPLHSFTGKDGNYAGLPLCEGLDGNFYGVTQAGGITEVVPGYGAGAAFRMTPSGTTTRIHSFGVQDIEARGSGLIQARNGWFYGAARFGGATGFGVVFRTTAAGAFQVVHHFNNYGTAPEGAYPNSVMQAKDGNFYGTTAYGGRFNYGTLWRMTPAGKLTVLKHFKAAEGYVGSGEYGRLLQGKDGSLYGVGTYGGAGAAGIVFRITTAGAFTVIHAFSGPDGAHPHGMLAQDSTGLLYGTTNLGGANGYGTVFKLNTTGTLFTVLHSFTHDEGADAYGDTVLAPDGFLYGSCSRGGVNESGTVWRVNRSTGALTVLYTFGSVPGDGGLCFGGLSLGPDGMLYGATYGGGTGAGGTLFRTDPATGTTATVFSFPAEAYLPTSRVLVGSDCRFYGTAIFGGDQGWGAVYAADNGLGCAADVSSRVQVTKTSPVFSGGVWKQKLTIKNVSADKAPILGPIQAALLGLPAGAALVNKDGVVPAGYGTASGNPYKTAPGGVFSLGYLKSVTLDLQFSANPGTGYTVRTFTGRF